MIARRIIHPRLYQSHTVAVQYDVVQTFARRCKSAKGSVSSVIRAESTRGLPGVSATGNVPCGPALNPIPLHLVHLIDVIRLVENVQCDGHSLNRFQNRVRLPGYWFKLSVVCRSRPLSASDRGNAGSWPKNKDAILSCGLQIVQQPVVQVVRHISTCNRIPASVAVLVQHNKVCVFVIKRISALRITRWTGVKNVRRDTCIVLVVIVTTQ